MLRVGSGVPQRDRCRGALIAGVSASLRSISYRVGMTGIPAYRRSARTDVRMWLLLIVGGVFFWTGMVVDPADNCSADGRECAPWLVPLAQGFGALIGLGAILNMLANPNRGSCIDPATGDLMWWQRRIGKTGGDEGRIHPSQISRIRIIRGDESEDEVHLYGIDGLRLFWFDQEVIPWPHERWAEKLVAVWPHITVEVEG